MSYLELQSPRFTSEAVDGYEQITVRVRWNILVAVFLFCWLGAWTIGGASAVTKLFNHFQPFVLFWLGGWAVGEIYVAATLCWLVSGRETLRLSGVDLEVSYRMFFFASTKLFRGSEIRNLSSHAAAEVRRFEQPSLPFLSGNKVGSVKFTYGPRTIYIAAGLDEPEGRLIVDRLRRHLPSTAAA